MTEKSKNERWNDVFVRLRETEPGETICLSSDEVVSVLKYIEELRTEKEGVKK